MKKYLILLIFALMAHMHAHEEDLLVLLPAQYGDIAHIESECVETPYVSCSSCADGVVHYGLYKDGFVRLAISGTTSSAKKEIGMQRIYRKGKEISKSKEFFLDKEKENTIVHVHDKYIVTTSPEKQVICPK